jgi:3-deoxy-D-manno-octulosonic-acid transferase
VVALCAARGYRVGRQSAAAASDDAEAEVVVGDTMGELLYLYGLADVAFVGGSLVQVGGHNPIEPALCGVPAVTGPAVFNFEDVVRAFRDAGALAVVDDADGLTGVLADWLGDAGRRAAAGDRARAVVAANKGAGARLEALLDEQIRAAVAADGGRRRVG